MYGKAVAYENFVANLQDGLSYMGYVFGLVLLFETLVRSASVCGSTALNMVVISLILWFFGYLSRNVLFKKSNVYVFNQPRNKLKEETLYFLLSLTFVMLSVSIAFKYFPGYFVEDQLAVKTSVYYSPILNFISGSFVFLMLVNGFIFLFFLGVIVFVFKFLSTFMMSKAGYYGGDVARMNVAGIIVFAFLLVIFFLTLQIPFVYGVMQWLEIKLVTFLQENFQWLVDFVLVSPAIYYLYANFKGSKAVEEFGAVRGN